MADVATDEVTANLVYDILVAACGASERDRDYFVGSHTREFISEWRFCGALGFGGKVYRTDARQAWRVSMYREDETPDRLAMMQHANDLLAQIQPR